MSAYRPWRRRAKSGPFSCPARLSGIDQRAFDGDAAICRALAPATIARVIPLSRLLSRRRGAASDGVECTRQRRTDDVPYLQDSIRRTHRRLTCERLMLHNGDDPPACTSYKASVPSYHRREPAPTTLDIARSPRDANPRSVCEEIWLGVSEAPHFGQDGLISPNRSSGPS